MARRMIVVRGPVYFSPGDERAFFDWLLSIPCVDSVGGEVYDVHVRLKRVPSNRDLRELVALLHRYRMNLKSLAVLRHSRIPDWFAGDARIFGAQRTKPPMSRE